MGVTKIFVDESRRRIVIDGLSVKWPSLRFVFKGAGAGVPAKQCGGLC
jgi:hypothetical protein